MKQKILHSVDATLKYGQVIAKHLNPGTIIYFVGDLGAGKTTLIKGILQGLEYKGNVKSPSYGIIEPYNTAKHPTFHLDLYRLADPEELEFLGIREYFNDENICLIEWAEKGADFLPKPDIVIKLIVEDENSRKILISPISIGGQEFINSLD